MSIIRGKEYKGKIKYYRLKKYKRWKDATLDELIEVHTRIALGDIDLEKEEMVKERKGNNTKVIDLKTKVETPDRDVSIVKDIGVRRFFVEAIKCDIVKGIIKKNRQDIKWLRQAYSGSNITAKELAYLLDEDVESLKYYLRKYGIKKIPVSAQHQVTSVGKLRSYLEKPLYGLTKPATDETSEEFRDRYKELGFSMFNKIKDIVYMGEEEEDDMKVMKQAADTLNAIMKVELEAKKLLRFEKEKDIEMKERELEKTEVKEPVVINFNGDIDAQNLFMVLKETLENNGLTEAIEVEKVITDVAKKIEIGAV